MPNRFDVPIKVWVPETMLLLWDSCLLLRMSQLLALNFWGKELKISMKSCYMEPEIRKEIKGEKKFPKLFLKNKRHIGAGLRRFLDTLTALESCWSKVAVPCSCALRVAQAAFGVTVPWNELIKGLGLKRNTGSIFPVHKVGPKFLSWCVTVWRYLSACWIFNLKYLSSISFLGNIFVPTVFCPVTRIICK